MPWRFFIGAVSLASTVACWSDAALPPVPDGSVYHPVADSLPHGDLPRVSADTGALEFSESLPTVIASLPHTTIGVTDAVFGSLNGASSEIIGRIQSVGAGDSVFLVLDDRMSTLRLHSSTGRLLSEVGRPGRGPGEFDSPKAMTIDDSAVYVLDAVNRVQRFRYGSSSIVLTDVFRMPIESSDICILNGRLFALGISTSDPAVIHEVSLTGQVMSSFGESYRSADPFVRFLLSEGRLWCDSGADLIVIAFSRVPEIIAFSTAGHPRWATRIEPFHSMAAIQFPSGTVRTGLEPSAYQEGDELKNLTGVDGYIVAQYAHHTLDSVEKRLSFSDTHTFAIRVADGRPVALGNGIPIVKFGADLLVVSREDPYPALWVAPLKRQ